MTDKLYKIKPLVWRYENRELIAISNAACDWVKLPAYVAKGAARCNYMIAQYRSSWVLNFDYQNYPMDFVGRFKTQEEAQEEAAAHYISNLTKFLIEVTDDR